MYDAKELKNGTTLSNRGFYLRNDSFILRNDIKSYIKLIAVYVYKMRCFIKCIQPILGFVITFMM